jgi:hypothetical protein
MLDGNDEYFTGQGIETIGLPVVVSSGYGTNLEWFKCSNNVHLALATLSWYSYFTVNGKYANSNAGRPVRWI